MSEKPTYLVLKPHPGRTFIGTIRHGSPVLEIFDPASGGQDDGGFVPACDMAFYGLSYITELRDFCNSILLEVEKQG